MQYIELGQVYAQMGKSADARRVMVQGLAIQGTRQSVFLTSGFAAQTGF